MKRILTFILLILPVIICNGSDGAGSDRATCNGEKRSDGTYYPKPEGSFRIVSYNVGAFSKYLDNSTSMIAAMLLEVEADVVGLNEVDSCNTRHNVNQAKALASAMGDWQWTYGRAMAYREGAYGNAVIAPGDVKIQKSYTIALPKGTGSEPRSIAVIETDEYILGAAHLDYTSEEAVLGQIEVVNTWAESLKETRRPVFFCGDMNSGPESNAIKALEESWTIISSTENTYSSLEPSRCIDFIFHYKTSAPVTVKGGHTMTKFHNGDAAKASDHLPIYADVEF